MGTELLESRDADPRVVLRVVPPLYYGAFTLCTKKYFHAYGMSRNYS